MHVIEGNTVTAMDKNTSQRGQYSKWLPRSPHMTFKMGPDLKMIVLVYRIIVQNSMLLPQNAQFIYKSDLPCCTMYASLLSGVRLFIHNVKHLCLY